MVDSYFPVFELLNVRETETGGGLPRLTLALKIVCGSASSRVG